MYAKKNNNSSVLSTLLQNLNLQGDTGLLSALQSALGITSENA